MSAASETSTNLIDAGSALRFDAERARRDFPILQPDAEGRRVVFLDSAASAQKPQCVIDAISDTYLHAYANIHRGVYQLSERATANFESARGKVQRFINAAESREIVFVRGTTEGINLVASSYGQRLGPGDEILITTLEHHSNIVPWQLLCERTGAVLKVAPIDDSGALMMDAFGQLLSPRTKIVAIAHASNALGTLLPVAEIVRLAHEQGAVVAVDGAQAVPHQWVDVQALGCDFYTFSGHKMFGPSGIGVLYGRAEILGAMPPYQGGGSMIATVSFEKTTYAQIPHRFEAGTPDIAGVVGLGAAIDYLNEAGLDAVGAHEQDLLHYATRALAEVPGLRLIGNAPEKVSVISFVLDGVHPHDVGTVLDQHGVAVRTGHHCAQPLMERFGVPATVRASFALYNTRDDIDALVAALHDVRELFA